jgi:hypothetical protein
MDEIKPELAEDNFPQYSEGKVIVNDDFLL